MKKLQWLIALVLMAASAGAQDLVLDAARRPAGGFPVQKGIWRLDGIDPDLGTADLEPLRRLIGDASVVGLGESFHTSGGFYVLKHRIFRYLVENLGFRAFAIESSWKGADLAADYVRTCQGTPEAAIRGHINVFQSTELADLVEWMCGWNSSHPDPADQLTFFGFDIQQPLDDGQGLIAFLRQIGIAESHPWIAGIRSCEGVSANHPPGQIPRESHDQCVQALDAVDAHFESQREEILRRMSEESFETARLQQVGLKAWEDQVFWIGQDYAAGFSARDEGMAYAFLTLKARRAPAAKTVIWAANVHVARTGLPNGTVPMGSHLAKALGRGYVSFALAAYDAEIDYPGFGCGSVERRPGTVEEKLHKLGKDALLVSLAPGIRGRYLKPGLYNLGVDRLDPFKSYTGLFFLEHSDRMHPLVWQPCQ